MSQHTPGPWRVRDTADVKGDWSCNEDSASHSCWQPIANADGAAVALVVDSGNAWAGRESFDADARLIAAAPELLEEVRKSAFTFVEMAAAFDLFGFPVAAEGCRVAERSNRALIAKAEGAA